jgi:hypothetical protein
MAERFSAVCTGCHFSPHKRYFSAFGTNFYEKLSEPQKVVQLEGLGKLKKIH